MFKNIIFDWSGVIKDASASHMWIINKILKRFGAKEISFEEFKENWEQPYMLFYNKYIPGLSHEDEHKAYVEAISDKNCPVGKDYHGIVDLVKKTKKKNCFLAVLSSDSPKTILPEMKKFGLEGVFNDVIVDVHDKKDGLEKIMKNNNLNSEETVFIGDTNHEVEVGKAAGIKTIAVTWGFCTEKRLEVTKPDYLAHNIKELENILLR